MEPLKPQEIDRILRERPDVTREDIEEYERLLAEHFQHDPFQPDPDAEHRLQRIHELHHKIFGFEEE